MAINIINSRNINVCCFFIVKSVYFMPVVEESTKPTVLEPELSSKELSN